MECQNFSEGWVVISFALRHKYGLKPGADLQVVDYVGVLRLFAAFKNPLKACMP